MSDPIDCKNKINKMVKLVNFILCLFCHNKKKVFAAPPHINFSLHICDPILLGSQVITVPTPAACFCTAEGPRPVHILNSSFHRSQPACPLYQISLPPAGYSSLQSPFLLGWIFSSLPFRTATNICKTGGKTMGIV